MAEDANKLHFKCTNYACNRV